MATGNPALNERYFASEARSASGSATMTVQGAMIKSGVLTAIMVAVAAVAWGIMFPHGVSTGQSGYNPTALLWALGGMFGGFVLGLIICFAPKSAPMLAPIYA